MEDTSDGPESFDVMKALYRQYRPRYLVTIAGSPAVFTIALKKTIAAVRTEKDVERSCSFSTEEDGSSNAILKIVCKKENNFERCSHRVRCLRLASEPRNASNVDRITFLNSILNFKCAAMIHALGALLLFVDKHWNEIALDPSGKPSFLSLDHMALASFISVFIFLCSMRTDPSRRDLVMVDDDTYRALNIVQARDHPSLFKFGQGAARIGGTSVFALFKRYCRSRPGALFLWKTMQHPSRDAKLLERRLNAVEFFLNPSNQSIVDSLSSCLNHVDRLTSAVLACCSGPRAKPSNWYKLHKVGNNRFPFSILYFPSPTISHVIRIADLCEEHTDGIEIFRRIANSVTNEMRYVKYFIEYIIDFAESRREKKLVVKPNVDPLLDELNHARRTLPDLLTRMAEKDMRDHLPASVTGCNMVYLPNIGYVLAINKWNPTPPEDMEFPNLEFKFSVKDVHYYKSFSAKELDETVGDVILKIAIRQNRIVQKLSRYAKKNAGSILRAIELCAELDTLMAFARVARDYNYARPTISGSKIIDAKETRHPLVELSTTFVPNDVRSGNGGSLIKLLTGPNSCGKSVYLKQIGLLIYMAHIGSYVAAKSATIGTVDRILTQISNTESIGLNASSFCKVFDRFGIECSRDRRIARRSDSCNDHSFQFQINVALRASTSDSVVLTDELEKGTTELSGRSLTAAVLSDFAARGEQSPHVFAATHAHAVLHMIPQTPLIEPQTFEYVADENQSLALLHRLTSGSVSRSFAHFAARVADFDENIVERSLQVEVAEESSLAKVFESIRRNALPSRAGERWDALYLVAQLCEARTGVDLKQLESLVRRIVVPRGRYEERERSLFHGYDHDDEDRAKTLEDEDEDEGESEIVDEDENENEAEPSASASASSGG
ncbi:LOW QUALITY PROTEIN: mutS protein homolog 5-like [Halictus rubicundus]|uniref:LOW QUALITY PROTEIN: mutS protein homolog 5-like n=1 Tax=Halictus rubicundus TaxID=77578 RepID=UPI0040375E68